MPDQLGEEQKVKKWLRDMKEAAEIEKRVDATLARNDEVLRRFEIETSSTTTTTTTTDSSLRVNTFSTSGRAPNISNISYPQNRNTSRFTSRKAAQYTSTPYFTTKKK